MIHKDKPQQHFNGLSLAQAEAILEQRFKGKYCKLVLPGIKTVWGMVERISINTLTNQDIIVFIGTRQYSFEIPALNEVLTLLNSSDGNT